MNNKNVNEGSFSVETSGNPPTEVFATVDQVREFEVSDEALLSKTIGYNAKVAMLGEVSEGYVNDIYNGVDSLYNSVLGGNLQRGPSIFQKTRVAIMDLDDTFVNVGVYSDSTSWFDLSDFNTTFNWLGLMYLGEKVYQNQAGTVFIWKDPVGDFWDMGYAVGGQAYYTLSYPTTTGRPWSYPSYWSAVYGYASHGGQTNGALPGEIGVGGKYPLEIPAGMSFLCKMFFAELDPDGQFNGWELSWAVQNTGGVVSGIGSIGSIITYAGAGVGVQPWEPEGTTPNNIYAAGPAENASAWLNFIPNSETNTVRIVANFSFIYGPPIPAMGGYIDIVKLGHPMSNSTSSPSSPSGGLTGSGFISYPNANGLYGLMGTYSGYPSYENANGYWLYYDAMSSYYKIDTSLGGAGLYESNVTGTIPTASYVYLSGMMPEGMIS